MILNQQIPNLSVFNRTFIGFERLLQQEHKFSVVVVSDKQKMNHSVGSRANSMIWRFIEWSSCSKKIQEWLVAPMENRRPPSPASLGAAAFRPRALFALSVSPTRLMRLCSILVMKTEGSGSVYDFRSWRPWRCILFSELITLKCVLFLRHKTVEVYTILRTATSRLWKCVLLSEI